MQAMEWLGLARQSATGKRRESETISKARKENMCSYIHKDWRSRSEGVKDSASPLATYL